MNFSFFFSRSRTFSFEYCYKLNVYISLFWSIWSLYIKIYILSFPARCRRRHHGHAAPPKRGSPSSKWPFPPTAATGQQFRAEQHGPPGQVGRPDEVGSSGAQLQRRVCRFVRHSGHDFRAASFRFDGYFVLPAREVVRTIWVNFWCFNFFSLL